MTMFIPVSLLCNSQVTRTQAKTYYIDCNNNLSSILNKSAIKILFLLDCA